MDTAYVWHWRWEMRWQERERTLHTHDCLLQLAQRTAILFHIWFNLLNLQPMFVISVPKGLRACAVLLFGNGCLHAVEPMLWRHQEARMPSSGSCQALYEEVLQGKKSFWLPIKLKTRFEFWLIHSCMFLYNVCMYICMFLYMLAFMYACK